MAESSWTIRYIGKFKVGYANLNYNESACQSNLPPGCELNYGATVYHNLTAGYNIEPLNTRVDVGVDNLSDKQPPIVYQNNALNGNTDPNTPSGPAPRRSRSCGLQAASDSAEQIGLGAGSGESDAHTRGRLRNASGDLEQSCA